MLVHTNKLESQAVILSNLPPRPVSKIAMSTFSFSKYHTANAVIVSKNEAFNLLIDC